MATVQLSDLQIGRNFDNYTVEQSVVRNAFVAAGVLVRDPAIDQKAQGQGWLFDMPKWGRVANDEPNAGTDNPNDVAVPKKITTTAEIARKLFRNQGWSSSDLAAALAAQDPLDVISNQVADYWAGVNQTTILKIALGILADNVANDGGDMVYDIATDDAGAITDAERFDEEAMIMASQTMGDAKGALTAIAVHSVIHARMQRLGTLVDQFDPETGDVLFQTFMGKRVIVDDGMPAVAGTNRITYTSILFGAGAFGFGLGAPKTPTAVSREEAQGNGEGIETLWNRRHEVIHPRGFKVAGAQVASSATPNYAALATAANWDRVAHRKQVPLAFIQTNG